MAAKKVPTRAPVRVPIRDPGKSRVAAAVRAATPPPLDMSKIKLKLEYVDINDIVPYEWNARDNAKAVAAVKASIKTFGFIIPIVIDDDNVLAAGHTRTEAAKELGMDEVPAVRASHLTEEQIKAFRLIDNKVASIADWDFNLLAAEMQELEGLFDMTDFGWSTQELDCLSSMVADDCLTTSGLGTGGQRDAADAESNPAGRRAPTRARFVLGELCFFEDANLYRAWVQGLRELHNFDEELIAEDLKRRLGILV